MRPLTMTLTGRPSRNASRRKMVTASLLPMLRVAPASAATFTADDDQPGAAGVVLFSDALWRRRFGAAMDAIGRAITLDNQPYTIVGVLPPRFQLLQTADDPVADRALGRDAARGSRVASRHLSDRTAEGRRRLWQPPRRSWT